MDVKKILRLTSTSYLIPKNSAWKLLENKFSLIFSEYGDWHNVLTGSDQTHYLVAVVFLEDLMGTKFKFDEENALSALNLFLGAVKIRLASASSPTLLLTHPLLEPNAIRRAKHPSISNKVYLKFMGELEVLKKEYSNFYHIDLAVQFSFHGANQLFDLRNWYFAHCHLSVTGIKELAVSISSIFERCDRAPSKLLVLDCDNTLWGGVVGEEGLSGITLGGDGLGMAFCDFQWAVKNLMAEGVIVALASNNNEGDVWEVFDNHSEMVLKREDIVIAKIDWNEKVESLKQLAEELDLGLDSLVFWDDNPLERAKMQAILPEVLTVNVPESVLDWPNYLVSLDCFSKFAVTDDDVRKTSQYHNRARFIKDSRNSRNELEYLKSIKLTPKIHELSDANIARAEQLCAKTNQFNLRTIRYQASDLHQISENNNQFCFLVSLSDIYGDHGIVGLVTLKHIDFENVFIDTFLLSCRVLGRHLEAWVLKIIVNIVQPFGYKCLVGEFKPTNKNLVVKDFYLNHNFRLLKKEMISADVIEFLEMGAGDSTFYSFDLKNSNIPYVEIYEK
jgi:FkbH-like protein